MHDYHIHNHFCRHATGSLADYARQAVRLGLSEICMTPHIPLPGFRPGFCRDRLRMDLEEFPLYLEELERTRGEFPELTILSGIEADYLAGWEGFLSDFLSAHDFDFVLMSVHFIADWPEGQWVFGYADDPRPRRRIVDDYLDAVRAGIDTGLFDCVAHLDLIKQQGSPLLSTHREEVAAIIAMIRDQGMSAEINTSGSRKEIGEPYPCGDIVQAMIDAGLPLVPSSDAHDPAHVGLGFEAIQGTRFVRYRKRKMVAD
jgi:histidinol-phosphatase (PHP family)